MSPPTLDLRLKSVSTPFWKVNSKSPLTVEAFNNAFAAKVSFACKSPLTVLIRHSITSAKLSSLLPETLLKNTFLAWLSKY